MGIINRLPCYFHEFIVHVSIGFSQTRIWKRVILVLTTWFCQGWAFDKMLKNAYLLSILHIRVVSHQFDYKAIITLTNDFVCCIKHLKLLDFGRFDQKEKIRQNTFVDMKINEYRI